VEEVPYQPAATAATGSTGGARFYSPLVLNIAQSEGISMSELENIPGTGQDGRVSKKDILAYVANRGSKPTAATQTVQVVTQVQPQVAKKEETAQNFPVVYQGNVEVIEMDRMRKLIAKHMVDSKHTSAHVTSFAECDVTNLVLWMLPTWYYGEKK